MMTGTGVILGTAAYMSPEQAKGRPADKRTDIWAFGCVLYEMLTGARTFDGTEITEILAGVLRDEPDWRRLPAETPAAVRRLLRRSLKKDPRQRLADIADAGLELDDAGSDEARDRVVVKASPSSRRPLVWGMVAATSLLLVAVVASRGIRRPAADLRVVRFNVPPPPEGTIDWSQPVSPDGRTLAFIVNSEGKAQIFVRPVDSAAARPLPGSEGATRSFWSPDSQHVAYFADGNLKEAGINGTSPRTIAQGPFRDGAWSTNGVILVGGQIGRPLMRVSARGGEPVAETALNQSLDETSHDYPEFFPDGRHYIYLARRGVRTDDLTTYVGTLGAAERRSLPGIRSAAKYSPSGHLLFLRGSTLMAQSFNVDRLELSGDAFPVADQVAGSRVATFSVSDTGTLAFIGGFSLGSRLTWFDRTGSRLASFGPVAMYENVRLSPDASIVAFERGTPPDVWILDRERMGATKITTDRAADAHPIWSPNGQLLAFTSHRGGSEGIYQRPAQVAGDDRLLHKSDVPVLLTDWSRDGEYLAYAAGGDIWALPLSDARKPLQLTTTSAFEELAASFSPDSRWIAYQSNESTGITRSGEGDVFVQSFPQRGFKRQVSTAGGFAPHWSSDGRELFYIAPDGMLMAVPVSSRGATLDIGLPKPLFRPRFGETPLATRARYSVATDGRFLIKEGASELSVTVILNWFEQVKRGGTMN